MCKQNQKGKLLEDVKLFNGNFLPQGSIVNIVGESYCNKHKQYLIKTKYGFTLIPSTVVCKNYIQKGQVTQDIRVYGWTDIDLTLPLIGHPKGWNGSCKVLSWDTLPNGTIVHINGEIIINNENMLLISTKDDKQYITYDTEKIKSINQCENCQNKRYLAAKYEGYILSLGTHCKFVAEKIAKDYYEKHCNDFGFDAVVISE